MRTLSTFLAAVVVVLSTGCQQLSSLVARDTQPNSTDTSSVIDIKAQDRPLLAAISDNTTDNFGALNQAPVYYSAQGAYKGQPPVRHIGDYVKNLTQDLVSNMEYVTEQTPVAITHFALIDSNLQQTNLLGHQMAESFMHEFHKFRIPVVDIKTMDFIRVTDDGDFSLSRDYLELKANLPIEYVLTGTLTRHQGGVMVNARVVGVTSRAVVATAQSLIPHFVVDAILPNNTQQNVRDGVRITKG